MIYFSDFVHILSDFSCDALIFLWFPLALRKRIDVYNIIIDVSGKYVIGLIQSKEKDVAHIKMLNSHHQIIIH